MRNPGRSAAPSWLNPISAPPVVRRPEIGCFLSFLGTGSQPPGVSVLAVSSEPWNFRVLISACTLLIGDHQQTALSAIEPKDKKTLYTRLLQGGGRREGEEEWGCREALVYKVFGLARVGTHH